MIQRKQSVYLLLGALAIAAIFLLDGILHSPAAETLVWFRPAIMGVSALTAILALVTIFLYSDRQRQQKMVVGVQVLTLIFIVLAAVGFFLAGGFETVTSGPNAVESTATLVAPFVAYIFFYLARRGIQSDIALVRSMDRLR